MPSFQKTGQHGNKGDVRGAELLEYKSINHWFESLKKIAGSKGKQFKEKSRNHRLCRMMEYLSVEYPKGNKETITPDFLLKEAKNNIDETGNRLQAYFDAMLENGINWNGAITQYSYIRGFYTHNDITFPKRMKTPKPHISTVKKTDTKTAIYDYDEDKDETIFKNGLLQQFFDNLSFRDQTIGLCLLSSGLDGADLFALNIGFAKDAKGNLSTVKRFFLHGNRLKDGIEYKTFFSTEATEYIKRYIT